MSTEEIQITSLAFGDGGAGAASREDYRAYRRLRHAVFVDEQGWQALAWDEEPGLTPVDPADAQARFWLARTSAGALVGIVRVCAVHAVFPHEELFARHLAASAVVAMRQRLGSLNSLAVDLAWRRRTCVDDRRRSGTVASLLLDRCLEDCRRAGIDALVATAQTLASLRALMRAGFHVIDAPARTALHSTFTMCNVGCVVSPTDHAATALAEYFRRCEQGVLGALMDNAGVEGLALAAK